MKEIEDIIQFFTNSSPVSYCVIERTPREYMWMKYFTEQMFS